MEKVLKQIMKFQSDRGMPEQDYDDLNEHANILEELIESIGYDVPKKKRPELKSSLQAFMVSIVNSDTAVEEENFKWSGQVDAYCDIIVFCVGALMKLKADPIIALEEAGKEINSRVGKMVDGKFEKDVSEEARKNWYKADYKKAKVKK